MNQLTLFGCSFFQPNSVDPTKLDEEITLLEKQSMAHPLDKSFRDQIKAKQTMKEEILSHRKKQERFGKKNRMYEEVSMYIPIIMFCIVLLLYCGFQYIMELLCERWWILKMSCVFIGGWQAVRYVSTEMSNLIYSKNYVYYGNIVFMFVIGVPLLWNVGLLALFPIPQTTLSSLSIIGETNLTSTRPYHLVHAMLGEAKMIWEQKDVEWMTDINTTVNALVVQSKPMTIEGLSHSLPGQRAEAMVHCPSANHLFTFMTGPEGFAVIDNVSRKEDFYKPPLKSYFWTRGKLAIERAITPMIYPYLPREFVVLNVRDKTSRILGSKSVIYPIPNYLRENFPVKRVVYTFYMKISSTNQKNICKMQFFNVLNGVIPHDGFSHYVASKLFFPQLLERLQAVYPTPK